MRKLCENFGPSESKKNPKTQMALATKLKLN